MVFCYKMVTDRPAAVTPYSVSRGGSPKRPGKSLYYQSSSMSDLVAVTNYDRITHENLLDEIPDKDWKLLSVLALKRDEDEERRRMAEYCHRQWRKEIEQRHHQNKAMAEQYRRYIHHKRSQEREAIELRRSEKDAQERWIQEHLNSYIRHKELRSQDLRDQKKFMQATYLLARALNDELRAKKVVERRDRLKMAQELQKKLTLCDVEQRVEEASKRRDALLKDIAQRRAINNAMSQWEASLVKQETTAEEFARRANYAAKVAMTEAKCAELARAKHNRIIRARRIADLTGQLRDMLKCV